MRLLTALTLGVLLLGSAQAQQLKFRVSVQGQELGDATLTYTLLPNKGLRTVFDMQIQGPTGKASFQADETLAPDGTPTKVVTKENAGTGLRTITKTMSSTGVKVVTVTGGKTTTNTYPMPAGKNVKCVSNLWFFTVKPAVGAKDLSMNFNVTNKAWEQSVETYVGVKTITSQGKQVKAHLIQSKETNVWVNDKGLPYQIELLQGGVTIRLERK